ncbi:ribonuclease H-like domain-containing protein [Rhizophagus irregularis DAOM 181602=DAOM 197198]|nr:ribonuclease H-like domain-containing protein [Rhizophagus irregularis DAOM 181602=DAOM 197198]
MTFKDSEDIDVRDSIILKIDDGVIEWIVTELKGAMERTQKFKLIEIEQEEDNEIYDSEEEIEIIVEDKTWKLSEIRTGLRQLIVNPKEKLVREIMKFGIKEKIETGILLTSDFIRYYIFQEGRFDKSEDIKEWMDLSTKICNRCNKQKLDYMISEENGRCEECNQEIREEEQDELIELKNNLEKLGYTIDVSEIQRIKNFGVNNRIMVTEEFIERYMRIIELGDKELRREIHKWLNENTTWCERCEIRWMNYMFRLGKTVCKDCEEEDIDEIDDRVKRLQKIFEDIGTIITEEELLRLTSMGYTDGELLDKEFIEIFQENKNESEKELKKKLNKLLKEQAGIIESEESGEKSDNEESEEDNTDDSEKTGEILSPDEIWDENIENFNEDEFEDEIENDINRGGSDLSQNSDTNSSLNIKNSDNESELSDYNLQDLFQENMATENQVKRLIENALGYPANTLNAAVGVGASLIDRIENAGNEAGGTISIPLFHGKEDEDVNDWVRQFEVAFTAVGKAAGANGVRQAAYAAAHLRGAAAQWYIEMKELNAGHLVNWADVDNDNDLKHRIKKRFTREDVRRKKMLELRKTRQEVNESVEEYTRRFRQILRIATRGHALADEYQVDFYIEGLEPTIGYQVRRQNPANLNGAIDIAVREEGAKDEFIRKAIGTPISARIDIGKDDNRQNMFAKPLSDNYEDELVKAFEEKARISKLEGLVSNIERRLNNDNRNRYQSDRGRRLNNDNRNSYQPSQNRVPTCFRCNRVGHYKNNCPEGRNARVNMINGYYDQEEYDYDEYGYEEPQYNEVYYTQGYYDDYEDRELNYYNELYAKDNAVKPRRQTRRTNPIVGYKNNNEERNLQEELREAGNRMDDREIPSGILTPRYTPERTEQNWDNPIGPENYNYGHRPMTRDGKFYKPMFTKEGKVFYPGM